MKKNYGSVLKKNVSFIFLADRFNNDKERITRIMKNSGGKNKSKSSVDEADWLVEVECSQI